MLFCATSWRYMTRLLKTAIIGCSAARVDSSRIDMLAGLSKCDSLRMPPLFCAPAGGAAATAINSPPVAIKLRKVLAIPRLPPIACRTRHANRDVAGRAVCCRGLTDTTEAACVKLGDRRRQRTVLDPVLRAGPLG